MKRLVLDIETSPNLAHVWGLWSQNVSLTQLQVPSEVIAFAAKWHGDKRVEFRSTFHDGKEKMLERAHALLSEADVVIHFNGTKFDMPHLHREFLLAGMQPPAPVQQVDLYLQVKKHFRFVSNKLDHVSKQLGLEGKTQHTGHALWVACLAGDEKAWALMRRYNIQDIRLTESVYDALLPWLSGHPSTSLVDGAEVFTCQCGSTDVQRRGYSFTALGKFQRLQCNQCGAWFRSTKRISGADVRGVSS